MRLGLITSIDSHTQTQILPSRYRDNPDIPDSTKSCEIELPPAIFKHMCAKIQTVFGLLSDSS